MWHPNGLFMPLSFAPLLLLFLPREKACCVVHFTSIGVPLPKSNRLSSMPAISEDSPKKFWPTWNGMEKWNMSNETTIEWVVKPWNGETHVTWTPEHSPACEWICPWYQIGVSILAPECCDLRSKESDVEKIHKGHIIYSSWFEINEALNPSLMYVFLYIIRCNQRHISRKKVTETFQFNVTRLCCEFVDQVLKLHQLRCRSKDRNEGTSVASFWIRSFCCKICTHYALYMHSICTLCTLCTISSIPSVFWLSSRLAASWLHDFNRIQRDSQGGPLCPVCLLGHSCKEPESPQFMVKSFEHVEHLHTLRQSYYDHVCFGKFLFAILE